MSIFFGIATVILLVMLIYALVTAGVYDEAQTLGRVALMGMGVAISFIISVSFVRYSEKLQRSFDYGAYKRLRNKATWQK